MKRRDFIAGFVASAAWSASNAAPIRVGPRRQLFIDDSIVGSIESLTRVLHRPQKHPGNPVLTGTEPWEKWAIAINGRAVLYDEETREFRMWYIAALRDPAAAAGTRFKGCYAVSRDGIHWTKPNLGQVQWEGSRDNNILPWGENWLRRANVIKDAQDPDPDRRFKMTYADVIGGRTAIVKAYSRDGLHWRLNGDGKPWFRGGHNSNLLGWDPRTREYVLFPRVAGTPPGPGKRSRDAIGRSTSRDFVSWSEPQMVIEPGPEDGEKNFKGLAAFVYGDLYLGFLWVFDWEGNADAELAFSHDCIQWQRASPGWYFFPRGEPGSWDRVTVMPVAPVIHQDRIWIYYSGANLPHQGSAVERAESGWVENGERIQRAGGLATLRLDGFASLDAGARGGNLLTRLIEAPGGDLAVNADVRGEMRAEILDEAGRTLPGYASTGCVPVRSDGLRQVIRWQGSANLEALRGKPS